jgi:hypothetical protein
VLATSVRRRVVFPVLQPSASFVRLHGGRSWVGERRPLRQTERRGKRKWILSDSIWDLGIPSGGGLVVLVRGLVDGRR